MASRLPSRSLRLGALALAGALLPGCVSHWRGKDMEADIVALQGQFESMREDQRVARKKLEEQLQGLVQKLVGLETNIKDAIERLRTGSADHALEQDKFRDEIAQLKGQLEETKRNLEQQKGVSGMPAVPETPGAPALPEDEAELYRYGYERKQANDCAEAIRAFSTFATRFPANDRADNGLFLLAECQHSRGEYTESIRALQLISQKYGTGDKVDDALLLMHDNFVALNRCKDAMPFLDTLIADYPRSTLIKIARKRQAQTKKTCK